MFGFGRKENAQLTDLLMQIAELRRQIDVLRADHELLKSQHVSLRGYTYAKYAHNEKKQPQSTAPPSEGGAPARHSRDQLRAMAGIRPGQPYPHQTPPAETTEE